MEKALSTSILSAIRDWMKEYVSAHSPQTVAFNINFDTGELEYITGSDIVFEINTVTGSLDYRKGT